MLRRDFFRHVLAGTVGVIGANVLPGNTSHASFVVPPVSCRTLIQTKRALSPSEEEEYIRSLVRTFDDLMPLRSPPRRHPKTFFEHLSCGSLAIYDITGGLVEVAYSYGRNKKPKLFKTREFLVPTCEYSMVFEPTFDRDKDLKTIMNKMILMEVNAFQELYEVIPGCQWSHFFIAERQSFTMLKCGPGPKYPRPAWIAYHETSYALVV